MSFLTLDDLHNNIAFLTDLDDKFQTYLDRSTEIVKTYIGFNPEKTEFNETYYFSRTEGSVIVANYPIVDIYSLTINEVAVDEGLAIVDEASGIITFNFTPNSTTETLEMGINYSAGYDPVPSDIRDAVLQHVIWSISRQENYGVRSMSVAESTTNYELDMPINIKNQLNRYVRKSMFQRPPVKKLVYGTK